jgi:hypothetical protein
VTETLIYPFYFMESAQSSGQSSTLSAQQAAEQQAEAQRMQEVNFLLTNLLEREQATIKAVIGCLYDVGSVNLVNQRIRFRPLRPVARPFLKASKPVLTACGYRWVCKKCPSIITRWLQAKVKAKTSRNLPVAPPLPTPVITQVEAPAAQPMLYQGEIRRLRSQVRWTTAALAGVSAALAITINKADLKPIETFWQSTAARPPLLVNDQKQKSSFP